MSACALGAGIAAGEIDPLALCEHFLARIEALDGEHRVYLHVTAARARSEAKAAAARARKALGELSKLAKTRRAEIQERKVSL